jgi:hypothetical protein
MVTLEMQDTESGDPITEIAFGHFMANICLCHICLEWLIDQFIEAITIPTDLVAIMVEEGITDQKQEAVQCMAPTRHRRRNQIQISFKEDRQSLDGLHLEADLVDDLEAPVLENNLPIKKKNDYEV